jgi:hypothetical protein
MENTQIVKNRDFLPNGKFAKGNRIGRMKKKGYTIKDLTNTAIAYDKTHDITILQHYINQIIKDNQLLKDFVNKYVPTTTKNELTGADGSPLSVTLKKVIYSEEKVVNEP